MNSLLFYLILGSCALQLSCYHQHRGPKALCKYEFDYQSRNWRCLYCYPDPAGSVVDVGVGGVQIQIPGGSAGKLHIKLNINNRPL